MGRLVLPCSVPGVSAPGKKMLPMQQADTSAVAAIAALAEEGMLMPTHPEARLALAATVQRLANWTGAAVRPSPAVVVTIARKLEIAAHAEIERAVRQVVEEGQGWAVVASPLGLDALSCHVEDPARLAFDCCAALARRPRFLWNCPASGRCHGPRSGQQSGRARGRMQHLAADIAEWQH
jgi:hypothetical protein